MTCETAFDLAHAGYQQLPFVALGAVISSLSIVWVVFRKRIKRANWRKYQEFIPFAFAVGATWWTAFVFEQTYVSYRLLRASELHDQVSTVSGVVEDFSPMVWGRGHKERFSVSGKWFEYADGLMMPGFHRSSLNGGPIKSGLPVKIAYVGNDIVRIDICTVR